MSHLLGLFLGLLVAVATSDDTQTSAWYGSKDFNDKVTLYWRFDNDKIYLRLEGKCKSVLGLGWNPDEDEGAMVDADMAIVSKQGAELKLSDYKSEGFYTPIIDKVDNLGDKDFGQDDTKTWLQFSRPWKTEDDKDKEIFKKDNVIIWAYGESNDLTYHGHNRGHKHVDFSRSGHEDYKDDHDDHDHHHHHHRHHHHHHDHDDHDHDHDHDHDDHDDHDHDHYHDDDYDSHHDYDHHDHDHDHDHHDHDHDHDHHDHDHDYDYDYDHDHDHDYDHDHDHYHYDHDHDHDDGHKSEYGDDYDFNDHDVDAFADDLERYASGEYH